MRRKFVCLLFIATGMIRSILSDDEKNKIYNTQNNEYEENLKNKFGCIPPDEYNLVKHNSNEGFVKNVCLPKDYQVKEPPALDTKVGVLFQETKLLTINERRRSLTVIISLYSFWEDTRIKYLESKHKKAMLLPDITTSHDYLWTPFTNPEIGDLRQITPIKSPVIAQVGLMNGESANHVMSTHLFSMDSAIVYTRSMWQVKVFCRFDFSKYPFDEQICYFAMASYNLTVTIGTQKAWGYIRENQFDFGGYDLNRTYFSTDAEYNKELEANIGFFGFQINMTRQIETYFYQYYLPCMTIVTTSIFSFIVPLTAIPGRVMIVVTQFLTLTTVFGNAMVGKS